jgi:hypothetical protein
MPNGSIEVLWLLTLGTSSHHFLDCIQPSKYFPGALVLLFNREVQGIFTITMKVHRCDEYKVYELGYLQAAPAENRRGGHRGRRPWSSGTWPRPMRGRPKR